MLKRRLIWQLYPSFLLIIIISMAAIVWYGSKSFRKFHLARTRQELRSRAYLIENQIAANLQAQDLSQLDKLCKDIGRKSSTRITVILPDGRVAADSDELPSKMKNHADRPEFQQALRNTSGSSVRFSRTIGSEMMYLALPLKRENELIAVIRTSMPTEAIDAAIGTIYSKLFWAAITIALFTALISLIISRRISRPVEQMTQAARDFAAGDLDRRLALPGAVELADLAKALNEMAAQLNCRINTITRERSHIEAVLSSMAEGVLAVNSTGHIVSANAAAVKLLGIQEKIPAPAEHLVRNVQLQKYIKDILADQSGRADFVLQQNGRFLQLRSSAMVDSDGKINGAVLVLGDITQTRRLEQIRRDFVANVSHELKTPVTSIKGFVETLLDGAMNKPQEAEKFLQIISKHTDRLSAIIEDLLSLSRLEEQSNIRSLSFEQASVKETLSGAVGLANIKADRKKISVQLICDENLCAKMNAALIEQAVLNLIDNAIKYSPEGGRINVTARKKGPQIIIEVSDSGCGIAKEHHERIFERFYVVDKGRSRKLGGTGLGLSIVKHIAAVHNGSVTVTSRSGAGSCFTITIPA